MASVIKEVEEVTGGNGTDIRMLKEILWSGFTLILRDGQLKAKGRGSLPDDCRSWIADHRDEIIAALELREHPHPCYVCGGQGVAEINALPAELAEIGPRWYCAWHIPNTDTREQLVLAMARYRALEDVPGPEYHRARLQMMHWQVQQDLEEGIVNPWGWGEPVLRLEEAILGTPIFDGQLEMLHA